MWRLLVAACCFSLISCATAISGTHENVAINSSPPGADALVVCDGQRAGSGVTPTTISIRRKSGNCLVKVTKDGYEDGTEVLERGMNHAYWTNMVFAPVAPIGAVEIMLGDSTDEYRGVAMIVGSLFVFSFDFMTGAAHAHYPHKLDLVLRTKDPVSSGGAARTSSSATSLPQSTRSPEPAASAASPPVSPP
jgi:hypothetical protein